MTVKELQTLLEFYPINAEIYILTPQERLIEIKEFDELTKKDKNIALVIKTQKTKNRGLSIAQNLFHL